MVDKDFSKGHTEEVILVNKVQCLDCLKILESTHRHDYRTCDCPNSAMVDGGKEYLRRGGMDGLRVLDLSIVETRPVPCATNTFGGKEGCWRCEMEESRKRFEERSK